MMLVRLQEHDMFKMLIVTTNSLTNVDNNDTNSESYKETSDYVDIEERTEIIGNKEVNCNIPVMNEENDDVETTIQ